jgi:hypothetical protein
MWWEGSTFPNAGIPLSRIPFLIIQNNFAIGVLLYRRRCEIGSARIHPATGVSWRVPIEAMTCCAIGAVDFVSFFDARLQIGRCGGNTVVAASSNQDAFYSGREKGLEIAGLMKGVEFYLSDSHDHDDGTGRKNNQYNENPEPHLVDSA